MDFEYYKREINLIQKQNNVECDLYDLIGAVLKGCKKFKNKSVRNISNRRRNKSRNGDERCLWGIFGFPDFVIVDEDYEPKKGIEEREKIWGAVEAKRVGYKMPKVEGDEVKNKDIMQLIGHIMWFDNVIYTNGIEWRIYNKKNTPDTLGKDIEDMQNKSYENRDMEDVNKKLESFRSNHWYKLEKTFVLRDEKEEWKETVWKAMLDYFNMSESQ